MDIGEMENLCSEWKNRLRLQQWEVAIRIARQKEFEDKNSQGECHWTLSTALATIKILDPIDYPDTPFAQDMEKTLVHELLHLKFCDFAKTETGSLEDVMMERAVDHLARALVELKRSGDSK